MINLETFVWDMPTGVLRDVWLALSSLQNRNANQECRLERVWVRWHDNSEASPLPPQSSSAPSTTGTSGSTLTNVGWTISPGSNPPAQGPQLPLLYSQSRVEYPTLSVLPPLRSLSVLDVDELDYLDEMSVLIAKSKDRLRELRVGISAKAVSRDFAISWDGPDLHQVDHTASWPGASTIGDRRLGGVLGVLLGRVFDIRKKQKARVEKKEHLESSLATSAPIPSESHITLPIDIQSGDVLQEYIPEPDQNTPIDGDWTGKQEPIANDGIILNPLVTFNIDGGAPGEDSIAFDLSAQPQVASTGVESTQTDGDSLSALISAHEVVQEASETNQPILAAYAPVEPALRRSQSHSQRQSHFPEIPSERERLEGKLRLQTLELERIPLSVAVLQKAFDWSVLTNLTILDCPQHDRLWTMLRRHFAPSPLGNGHSSTKQNASAAFQYHLNLRKIHTDAASPALISFLKDTLAPNTLETLFLQDRRRSSTANVTIVRFTCHIIECH